MAKIRLTPARKRTLLLFLKHELENRYSPSRREIQEHHNWSDKGDVVRHMRRLERLGLIRSMDTRYLVGDRRNQAKVLTPRGRFIALDLKKRAFERAKDRMERNWDRIMARTQSL